MDVHVLPQLVSLGSMPLVKTETIINAPIDICFDLARSIDLHEISTAQTKEKAIDGVTSGLIELGQSVTWKARHFGIYQKLTAQITEMERPYFFIDEMVEGAFKSFKHEHRFQTINGKTLMADHFDYKTPYGPIGWLFDALILRRYMRAFLQNRNNIIKQYAESEDHRHLI